MRTRELARTGVQIPAIGQGTWRMGGRPPQDAAAVRALRLGFEHGMTLVDTAEMYGNGHAERLVGQAIRESGVRPFVVTKVRPHLASYEGVLRAAQGSLRRLGVERIDLYLLHWPSEEHPLGQTMRAMRRLIRDGVVRFAGVSNFTVDQCRQAEEELADVPLTCNQVYYWLGQRAAERRLLRFCEAEGITLMAYSPLGSGRFAAGNSPGGSALAEVARELGVTPPQVALAWLVHKSPAVVAIPKAVQPEHVRANARAADVSLDAMQLQRLEAAFPLPPSDEPLPMI